MKNKQSKGKSPIVLSRLFWSITSIVCAVLLINVIVGGYVAMNVGSAAINLFFGTKNTVTITDPNAKPLYFFTSEYEGMEGEEKYTQATAESLFAEDKKVIEEAEAEGAVLLWNKESALPLAGTEKVSCLSHSSVDIVECGSGSGFVTTTSLSGKDTSVYLKDALESRGFQVNSTLWNFYKTGAGSAYVRTNPNTACTEWRQWSVNEVPWSVYTADVKNSFQTYNDVALVVISRTGGEYSDLHYNYKNQTDFIGENKKGNMENTPEAGGYLGLTDEEEQLLTNVVSGSTFRKVVLLLNTPNPMQFVDFEPYYAGIDACMWIGQPGTSGINAVADLLKGKDMQGNPLTPSGRIADTFVYDNNSSPSAENDGNYRYSGDLSTLTANTNRYNSYVVYQEGIYVGYRYYETRYADCVSATGNALSAAGAKHSEGNWNYAKEVAFPFGYGDSYTKFSYSQFMVSRNAQGDYDVSVRITNVGSVVGKEVVQVYLSKPYTDYDRTNGIEKSAIELVAYSKTKALAPNASETVAFTVPAESFKTYDANNKKTYIVEDGAYYLTVATDAHGAVNNVLAKTGKAVSETLYFGGYSKTNNTVLGAAFAEKIDIVNFDAQTYSHSTQTGAEITNRFDDGDINKYENRGSNSVVWLSRKDWSGTYPATPVLTMNAAMARDIAPDTIPDASGVQMPTYGKFASKTDEGVPNVLGGDRVAYEFMEAPLNPEKAENPNAEYGETGKTYAEWAQMWEQLLDQMTFEEQALMAANAYHQLNGAESVGLPASKQENGPVGLTKRSDFPVPDKNVKYFNYVSYPCAGILAATFNDDVVERIGQHKSEDMLYLGYNGIYGPGVNMHRTPFGGRAFEYPSEDPYLAGMTEYYESRGIESKGCLAYAKHFALNDTETNRRHVGVWSNEQATREIYLKAFELTFAEGGASATMNSFSRVGTKWNGGCYAMMTQVLREEWGWDGVNITDWMTGGPMSYIDAIMAGTDSFDGNGTIDAYTPYKNNAAVCQALRTSAKRIIYNVVRTNVMNGMDMTSKVIKVRPWWQSALYAVEIGFGITTGAAVLMTVLSFVNWKKSQETVVQVKEEPISEQNPERAEKE